MNFNIKAKKFVKSIIIITVFIYLAIFVMVKLIIDPYKEFNFFKLEINKKQFFLSSKVHPYLLSDKLINDKFTLIFGTSRSALIDGNMLNNNAINFSSSMYGNPIDIYSFLVNLDKKKIRNISQIYYLLDSHIFGYKKSYYKDRVYSNNLLDKLFISIKSFNITSIKDAYQSILMNLRKENPYVLKENGEVEHFNLMPCSNCDNIGYPEPVKFSEKAFESLSKVDSFAKNNKIKIIYFNVPLYDKFIMKMNIKEITRQSKKIVENIDYLYDFRCLPSISKDTNNFSTNNHPHYKAIKFALDNLSDKFKVNIDNVHSFYKNAWGMCGKL